MAINILLLATKLYMNNFIVFSHIDVILMWWDMIENGQWDLIKNICRGAEAKAFQRN